VRSVCPAFCMICVPVRAATFLRPACELSGDCSQPSELRTGSPSSSWRMQAVRVTGRREATRCTQAGSADSAEALTSYYNDYDSRRRSALQGKRRGPGVSHPRASRTVRRRSAVWDAAYARVSTPLSSSPLGLLARPRLCSPSRGICFSRPHSRRRHVVQGLKGARCDVQYRHDPGQGS
jgi:hypothetical protein